MVFKSDNPGHEVYIDGFQLLGDFIPYNTGVDRENTINIITDELTTGKNYTQYLNEKSEELSFKTILTDELAESGYEDVLKSVVAKAKKEPVKVMFDGKTFMGMVHKFSISFPSAAYREYDWHIVESEPFKAVSKWFNTYNYKKASTPTKKTSTTGIPTDLKTLLQCKTVYNCSKYKVKCVIVWQKQLKKDGYYGSYSLDGNFCNVTRTETRKWQKKYKIKVTGKVDRATKIVLIQRYLKTTKYNAATKKKLLKDYTKLIK